MKLRKIINILICLAISILAAGLCEGKSDYSKIINSKIFADPVPVQQKPVHSILRPAPVPSLDSILSLKGIIYNPDGDSWAIVEKIATKTELLLNQGDIVENAKLLKIDQTSVVFLYDEKEITLNLPKPQTDKAGITIKDTSVKVIPPSQSFQTVSGVQISSTLAGNPNIEIPAPQQPKVLNLNEITEKIRSDPSLFASVSVTPYIQDGRVEGFTVNRIPESGIFSQVGIQPGDVIKRVNGTVIDSLSKAYAVYNNVINSSSKLVTVEILRNGQPILLNYRLE